MRHRRGHGQPGARTARILRVSRRAARPLALAVVPLALLLAGGPAAAQDNEMLKQFRDWTAQAYQQDGAKICTMYSRPKSEEGDYDKRGDVWGFVIHRPADDRVGEVSFAMGYPLKEGSTVRVTIGERTFELFTDGEGAFARPEDDPKLIRMMRAGVEMVVKGTSKRGTLTTDTYSLYGFTNAHEAINEACGVG